MSRLRAQFETCHRCMSLGLALASRRGVAGRPRGVARSSRERPHRHHRQHAGRTSAVRRLARDACSTRGFRSTTWSFRNLGFSGDEVVTRLRSKNFGTPDEWLSGQAGARSAAIRRTASTASTRRPTSSSRSSATTSRTPARPDCRRSGSSSAEWIRHTLVAAVQRAARRRGSCCSRRSRTKISAIPTCRTGARTTCGSRSTRERWAKWRGRTTCLFVDLFTPEPGAVRDDGRAAHDQRHPPQRAKATG